MESVEHLENPICRLCCNIIIDGTFRIIEKTIREALENVGEKIKSVMCIACSTRLFAAFQFKANCIDTENNIFPYVRSEDVTSVDLKDIYIKERSKKHLRTMLNDQGICRLCLQKVAFGFVSVRDVEIDMIQNCIPEINFNFTKDPIICAACLYLLNLYNNFLKDYSNVDMHINNLYDNPEFVKTEEIEITYDGDNENCEATLEAQNGPIDDTNQYKFVQNSTAVDNNNYPLYEHTNILDHQTSNEDVQTDQAYRCDVQPKNRSPHKQLPYNRSKSDPKNCLPSQKEFARPRVHKCHICDYKSRQTRDLRIHLQKHKGISELEGFQCDSCAYRSFRKSDLKIHALIHKDISETKIFKCDMCDFKSKRKCRLNVHQLIHKSFSETEVFECATCGYKTKQKDYLKRHLVKHRDISSVKAFECSLCDYKGKRKYDLKSHLIKHKDISETTVFKCDLCDYETKYKVGLNRHLFRRHKIV